MSKARLLATSGICSAVAVTCLLLCGVAPWATLLLSVVASIAVVIPMLIDPNGLKYSLIIYAVASLLGTFAAFEFGGIVYAAPCVAFCLPFAIVKVRGESVQVSARVEEKQTFEDPFGQGEDTHVLAVQLDGKKRLPTVVRWVLYYVLLEVAIGLTLLAAYLLARPTFDLLVGNKFFYLLLAAAQLVVIPYNLLLHGCLIGTTKILQKVIK